MGAEDRGEVHDNAVWAAIRLTQERVALFEEDKAAADSLVRAMKEKSAGSKKKAKATWPLYVRHQLEVQGARRLRLQLMGPTCERS